MKSLEKCKREFILFKTSNKHSINNRLLAVNYTEIQLECCNATYNKTHLW